MPRRSTRIRAQNAVCRWAASAICGTTLWGDFDLHLHAGRDRDRLIERSMALVVLDEVDGLTLGRAR